MTPTEAEIEDALAREINWLANKKYNLWQVDKKVSLDLSRIAIAKYREVTGE